MENCVSTTRKLLTLIKVPHTTKFLKNNILSHPNYPSLLSISDTLNKYNVENIAIKIKPHQISDLATPCLVQVSKQGTPFFFILNSISRDSISYYDDKGKLIADSKANFLKIWTGICLLTEKSPNSGEIDFIKKRRINILWNFIKAFVLISFITWITIGLYNYGHNIDITKFSFTIFYIVLKIIGIIVTVFLLWYEVDQFNPTLQSFCSGGKQLNCNSVLNSKYSKILGDSLSVSILGFSYFFSTLLYLILTNYSSEALILSSFLSLFSISIIGLSFYYQGFVLKQWCKFCLIVQTILLLEVSFVIFTDIDNWVLPLSGLPLFLILLLTPVLIWKYLKQLLEKDKESDYYKRNYSRVANNKGYFNEQLSKSRKIALPSKELGIRFSQKNARYEIIKVCNPYCDPCAQAHPILEKLLKSKKINLQMIFSSPTVRDNIISKTVMHFMALYNQESLLITQQAIDFWYTSEDKNYEELNTKFPISKGSSDEYETLLSMSQWCEISKISHTPTIFINGYELPKEYAVTDLIDILS
tara:strand:- start:10946 stop:12535 length:1590 start_codon:yes stop_codon:yes gene_type:complete